MTDEPGVMPWEVFSKPGFKSVFIVAVYPSHKMVIARIDIPELADYIVRMHNQNIGIFDESRVRRSGTTNDINFDFLAHGSCPDCGASIGPEGLLHHNARAVWCMQCGWARGWSEIIWPIKGRVRS